jgi:reversibly glycosylated polypeptide / UDP-arabinopyranose mutase
MPSGQPKIVVVVPTIREQCLAEFLTAWGDEFAGVELLIVEDNPTRTFALPERTGLTHYCWCDIDEQLGDNAWIVPRRTDCVRSFGYWQAWQRQPDMIVTLDDDCLPPASGPRGFLDAHWQNLERLAEHEAWLSTTTGTVPRGVPYMARQRQQRCVLSHGLWTNVIDYDAVTQLSQLRTPTAVGFPDQIVPRGSYFPMCGMNLAWRPELTPALYFLLMGKDHGVDRFGDIWAGLAMKRIADHLGLAVHSGSPTVHHARASNVWANLRKEAPGMERNETLWRTIDGIVLTATTPVGCYRQLAAGLLQAADPEDTWLRRTAAAMQIWCDLFSPIVVPRTKQPLVAAAGSGVAV